MTARAYLLVDVSDSRIEGAVNILQNNAGVVRIDILEGHPDLMVIIEASGQKQLTELTLRAFASIKAFADDVRLLPVKKNHNVTKQSKTNRNNKARDLKKSD